jgi:NADP-dependent aldehyde dehydrogenase
MLVPLGPVAIFGASNFPLAFSVAGGDTASALAAGCPVVFKAHPAHPATSEIAGEAIVRALRTIGAIEGMFSMLHGPGNEIGRVMVEHPACRAGAFTGSQAGGRALFDAAARRSQPIPFFAEMSSVNPVIILPGALRDRGPEIATALAASVLLGVGQFCTKPGLVVVQKCPASARFRLALEAAMQAQTLGPMLHPGIRQSFISRLEQMVAAASAPPMGGDVAARLFTVDVPTFLARPALSSEIFGPATVLVEASSLVEMHRIAQTFVGQLTATIMESPSDESAVAMLLPILRRAAGRLIRNGYPTGVEVCPAMTHGGPYPATTDSRFTSVGTAAIYRFVRPVTYQSFGDHQLPAELQDANPLNIERTVNGKSLRGPINACLGAAP